MHRTDLIRTGIVAAYPDGFQTPADVGYAGLGDSLENRHGAAKPAPRDKRLAGDAAPAGNRWVLGLKVYPGIARMARLSPPAGSLA